MAADFTQKRINLARTLVVISQQLLEHESDLVRVKGDLNEAGASFADADFTGQAGLTHLTAYTPNVAMGDFLTDLTAFLDGHLQNNAQAAVRRAILHNLTGG